MAAGLGFKTFAVGEVLTAADTNGYLMQGVLVFASAAARDAAITSPQEGQFAYTKDTNGLWYYDGAAWVASGAAGDIEGVTAGTGISGGGTSGTVTITNSMATAIDAKGDLVAGTGADAFSRLAVGANDTVLTADSAQATGLKWATVSGGGLTLLSTTSLSGSSTTISSISGAYVNLIISIEDGNITSGGNYFRIAPNGYASVCNGMYTNNSNTLTGINNNRIYPTGDIQISPNTNSKNNSVTTIYNYSTSALNRTVIAAGNTNPSAAGFNAGFYLGSFVDNTAINEIVVSSSAGGSMTGTVKIYGWK